MTRIWRRKFDSATSADSHFTDVLRGAVLAFLLRIAGAGLAFGLSVAVGRLLGAEGAGYYFFALSIVTIAAVIAKLGLDNTLLRFVATGVATSNWNRVVGVFRLTMITAAGASLAASALAFLGAPSMAGQAFGDLELAPTLRAMSFGIFTFAMMTLLSEALKGLNRIRDSMLVSGVLFPAIALAAVLPLTQRFGAPGAAIAYVLGTGTAAILGLAMWRRAMASIDAPEPSFERADLWRSSRPLWTMAIITRGVLPWSPLFFLGIWGTATDAGVFGAAMRVAMLVTFLLTAVNTVIAPKFAELHAKGDVASLGRLARRFALLIACATSPMLIALAFARAWVMGLFGEGFSGGGTALAILAAGQTVNAFTGAAGTLLMMTGHERDARNASIAAGAATIVISLTLIPIYNIEGAAIATAVAVAISNLYSVMMIKKKLGISVLPWARD